MASKRSRRLPILLLAFPLIAVACGSGTDDAGPVGTASGNPSDASQPAQGAGPTEVEQLQSTPPDVTISGLTIVRGGSLDGAPEPLIDVGEIRAVLSPDGIPSIDEPKFLTTSEVDFLEENEPVLAFDIDGDVRAYPVQILTWHEIVNDTVGGTPVAVTYCPLCNSAVAYDRRVDDMVVDFGISGMLWNSALVMFDRQTETLWSHFTGEGIVGELTGLQLETFPVATVPWGVWRDANPDGLVLSQDTGFSRSYGRNPYPGYDDVNRQPFLFDGEVDGQYTAMTRILGIEIDDEALGVPFFLLQEEHVVTAKVAGTEIVALWAPGTASALDAGEIAGGDDVGATGVFIPVIDGQDLTFAPVEGGFVDDQTGSTWNILGTAVDGELEGSALEALTHVDTFWFAWSAFQPDTAIIE